MPQSFSVTAQSSIWHELARIKQNRAAAVSLAYFKSVRPFYVKKDTNAHVCADPLKVTVRQLLRTIIRVYKEALRKNEKKCPLRGCTCMSNQAFLDIIQNGDFPQLVRAFLCAPIASPLHTRKSTADEHEKVHRANLEAAEKAFREIEKTTKSVSKQAVFTVKCETAPGSSDVGGTPYWPPFDCSEQMCNKCGVAKKIDSLFPPNCPLLHQPGEFKTLLYVKDPVTDKSASRSMRLTPTSLSMADLLEKLKEILLKFFPHYKNCLYDSWDSKLMSETYRNGAILVIADYMANYTCGGVYSMNSVFGHPLFALVMWVSYNRKEVMLPGGKEMQQQKKWFFFMGEKQKDELAADYYHFCMCLQWLLQYCKENKIDVEELFDTTDNCSLEFKSRRLLVLLLKILKSSSLKHYHHRLCEAHNGKGECDGAGGVFKAALNDVEFHQQGRLANALACWEYAHTELRGNRDIKEGPRPYNTVTESREYIFTVDEERFNENSEQGRQIQNVFNTVERKKSLLIVDYKNEKVDGEKVDGISKFHDFYWNKNMSEGILYARRYHCSCEEDKNHTAFITKGTGHRADVLHGRVVNRTQCLTCFGTKGNEWQILEIREREHESLGTKKVHNDLTAL